MKPLIVHNYAGELRRLNPMQIVGWVAADIDLGNGRFLAGSVVAMAAGPPVQVRESEQQLDWLFTQATGLTWTPEDRASFLEVFDRGAGEA